MKHITDFINESLDNDTIMESKVSSEKDFREYAENKFKEVFGDELDEDKMNKTIDGLIKDNKELADAGDWGELIGILNKSFVK